MKDEDKTKEQLQIELRELRQRLVELEKSETKLQHDLQQDRDLIAKVLDTTDTLIRNFVGAVLDIANALVVVFDPDGRILNCNPTFEQTTLYSLDEVQGRHVWDLFPVPEQVNRVRSIFGQMKTSKGGKPIECAWIMKDGRYRHISWSHIILQNPDDSISYILGTGVDVTEQKLAEAEIRKALEKEKELNELKSSFVSIASHEFRTPLTTIVMSAEILEHHRDKLSQERQRQEFQRIKATVNRMTELIDDVLIISKAESRFQEFNPTSFNLEQFCRQLVEDIQRSTRSNHTIDFISKGVPLLSCMDESLLHHILTNLLSNAIKYSPKGGIVDFQVDCQDKDVRFQIKDSGIGIPPEDQKRLFETFHRAKNVGKIPGTGLGLSIVKRMVDLHGGQIRVESEVGMGTNFIVTIPLSRNVQIDKEESND